MTEKLYYKDAYIKDFTATVLSVTKEGECYAAVLDRTAFFPEVGGQSADSGTISGIPVFDVQERGGIIYHYTRTAPGLGSAECHIDFDMRFDKMQCHTAEHIICGIIHSLWGFDNVGFHLGIDDVTLDINAPMDREMLDKVEDMANEAVYKNLPVTTIFPMADELPELNYRSKLDITENVRIVNIEGYDSCACCAPHVARTGEIGLIKMLDFEKHRGGVRIHMLAGARALKDYREKYRNIQSISARLSVPQHSTADALGEYMSATAKNEYELKGALMASVKREAEAVAPREGNLVRYLPSLAMNEAREFVNIVMPKVKGITVALIGEEKDYKYIMASDSEDLKTALAEANKALNGKGGGRAPMMQGSFAATLDAIEKFFN